MGAMHYVVENKNEAVGTSDSFYIGLTGAPAIVDIDSLFIEFNVVSLGEIA